jgi:hypothetical protein
MLVIKLVFLNILILFFDALHPASSQFLVASVLIQTDPSVANNVPKPRPASPEADSGLTLPTLDTWSRTTCARDRSQLNH